MLLILFFHSFYYCGALIFFLFFLAVLDFRCCAWVFSSCGEWGLLFTEVHGLLIVLASLVADHRLSSCGAWGLAALRHGGSS